MAQPYLLLLLLYLGCCPTQAARASRPLPRTPPPRSPRAACRADASSPPPRDIALRAQRSLERRRLQTEAQRGIELARRRKFGFAAANERKRTHPLQRVRATIDATELSTSCSHAGDGFWFCELRHRDAYVGRLDFVLDSPDEAVQCLQDELTISVAELKAIDIIKYARGVGGGQLLMEQLVEVLEEHKVQFVFLKHLDRGSGKLVRWYQRYGFQHALDVLPNVKVADSLHRDHMVTETATLKLRLAEPIKIA
ncbi:hypothetical protein AB1Y20_003045 [Prymnesium parvum]|uniref:N-acetyltransferase domain-containing protein n=1 Tax=Prymnesium parvum TaxID=97485 RepID=A0AB34JD56_PRYPA